MTASGSWLQTRPAFLNGPISSFFLVSTLIWGSPAELNACRRAVMYANCRSRSGCAALDSSCLVFACSRYPWASSFRTDGSRRTARRAYRCGVRDQLPPGLPPDPFAGDPADPSAALESIEPGEPLDPGERLAVEEDLADLAVYEALLGHRGIRGLVVACEDCKQDHYHDWDMLRATCCSCWSTAP